MIMAKRRRKKGASERESAEIRRRRHEKPCRFGKVTWGKNKGLCKFWRGEADPRAVKRAATYEKRLTACYGKELARCERKLQYTVTGLEAKQNACYVAGEKTCKRRVKT
jgi:hypothetical protein